MAAAAILRQSHATAGRHLRPVNFTNLTGTKRVTATKLRHFITAWIKRRKIAKRLAVSCSCYLMLAGVVRGNQLSRLR